MGAASIGMDSVFKVGLKLPGVKESPYFGARALKLNGQMVVCTPVNKSAEVNSVVEAALRRNPVLFQLDVRVSAMIDPRGAPLCLPPFPSGRRSQ